MGKNENLYEKVEVKVIFLSWYVLTSNTAPIPHFFFLILLRFCIYFTSFLFFGWCVAISVAKKRQASTWRWLALVSTYLRTVFSVGKYETSSPFFPKKEGVPFFVLVATLVVFLLYFGVPISFRRPVSAVFWCLSLGLLFYFLGR